MLAQVFGRGKNVIFKALQHKAGKRNIQKTNLNNLCLRIWIKRFSKSALIRNIIIGLLTNKIEISIDIHVKLQDWPTSVC